MRYLKRTKSYDDEPKTLFWFGTGHNRRHKVEEVDHAANVQLWFPKE